MFKISPRILWVGLAVVALLAVTALLVISSKVHSFLRSEDFRNLVAEKTGDAFHADAEYAPLRWSGRTVFSDSLLATGRPGSIVGSVRADQVRAQVNWRAIFSGAWRVDHVEALNFEGIFQPGSPQGGADGGDPPVSAGGFASFLPSRFELGKLTVAQAHITFLSQQGSPFLALKDSSIVLEPSGVGWAIDGRGGTFTAPHVPALTVDQFRSRLQGDTFYLTDATFRLGDAGKVSASGEFADRSKLRLQWEQIDLEPFFDDFWKARFSGQASGNADLAWPESGTADGTATGTFRVTDGLVQKLEVLEKVANFTGAPQFRRMPVQEFSGNFSWAASHLDLTNLVFESKGLLRVEGTCTIASNGTVDGNLRVGVTAQTLQWLPGSRERVFTVSENGYVWTPLHVSGTTKNIKEDLSARLAIAMKDEVIQTGTKAIEVLPGAAKDRAKDVLDILSPLIGR